MYFDKAHKIKCTIINFFTLIDYAQILLIIIYYIHSFHFTFLVLPVDTVGSKGVLWALVGGQEMQVDGGLVDLPTSTPLGLGTREDPLALWDQSTH